MKHSSLLTTAALLALCAPLAFAGEHGPGPDEHVHLVAEFDLGGDHYYVLEDHGAYQIFRETNGVLLGGVDGSGVQPAWSCFDGVQVTYVFEDEECAAGVKTPPDEQVTNSALVEAVEESLPPEVHDAIHEAEHEILG